jgi:hypothetical protein
MKRYDEEFSHVLVQIVQNSTGYEAMWIVDNVSPRNRALQNGNFCPKNAGTVMATVNIYQN